MRDVGSVDTHEVRSAADTSSVRWSLVPKPQPSSIFCGGSFSFEGTSNGLSPANGDRSATRAARFAESTEANVARASTSVPPAVASAEMVTRSTASTERSYARRSKSFSATRAAE